MLDADKEALNGKGSQAEQAKVLARLHAQIAECDQVIGELTIANRVLKKLSGAVRRARRCARRQGQPRQRGRKPETVPAALAAPIRALAGQHPWWVY